MALKDAVITHGGLPESLPLYTGKGRTSITQTIKAQDRPKDVIDHDANVIRSAPSMWPKVVTDWVLFDRIEDIEGMLVAYPLGATMEADTGLYFYDTSDKYPFDLTSSQIKKIMKWHKGGFGFVLGVDADTRARVIKHHVPSGYDVGRRTLDQLKGGSMIISKVDLRTIVNPKTKPAKLTRLIGRYLLTEDQGDLLMEYDLSLLDVAEGVKFKEEHKAGLSVVFNSWNKQIGAERFKVD